MRDSFYSEFFGDMLPKIERFIRARFPSDLAADLASETMLILWRKQVPVPRDEVALRKLRSLTYKIALGLIANAERKFKRDCTQHEPPAMKIGSGADPTFEAIVPIVLAEAIGSLEFKDRQAVNLLIAGFKTKEIADILEITPKAASMRLARARRRLDANLSAQAEESDGARA